jgi:hypothetical protein
MQSGGKKVERGAEILLREARKKYDTVSSVVGKVAPTRRATSPEWGSKRVAKREKDISTQIFFASRPPAVQ